MKLFSTPDILVKLLRDRWGFLLDTGHAQMTFMGLGYQGLRLLFQTLPLIGLKKLYAPGGNLVQTGAYGGPFPYA